ncbi:anti-immunity antitoxin [Escherichia phage AugustSocin]|uniref:Discriminator of mRNA degradation n=1 Tax=Escherichia phage RB14 TaxID=2681597 RepID=C3V199_9CAUD|nr:Dmd discriminator of mRNA degradation [Escherichia phage RB14]ACP30681.1 discriminator of mRNA degradation [Escherichia phage RB14]QXV76361.1 anti-immunity antitoxin [Escherichia phage AugustSocin]WAK44054.1 discriminator of mRNA degradation [Escherichia virus CAM-21]
MELVKVVFMGWFKNENMFTKEITMMKDDVQWATTQYAEVNKALVKAFIDDKKVCEVDCRG